MSSVNQAVIDLVEGVSIWGVPGLEVDSFVHEVLTFDRLLPACGKVDQSTLMQVVLAYRWLMYGFPANFCVCVSYHQLHVLTWAGCVCLLQLFIKLILGLCGRGISPSHNPMTSKGQRLRLLHSLYFKSKTNKIV
jgi:hypothetical protein